MKKKRKKERKEERKKERGKQGKTKKATETRLHPSCCFLFKSIAYLEAASS